MHESTIFYADNVPYEKTIYDYESLGGNAQLEETINERCYELCSRSILTQKEYDALFVKDNNTMYFITNNNESNELHPVICTQCGGSFKLAYDGSGKCPYCDTYYSKYEIK